MVSLKYAIDHGIVNMARHHGTLTIRCTVEDQLRTALRDHGEEAFVLCVDRRKADLFHTRREAQYIEVEK